MRRPTPLRLRLQATAALAGAGVFFAWRGGPLATAVLAFAAVLALLSWAAPRVAAPVHQALDRAVAWALAGLTWLLLALVFTLVFVPGRLFIGRARRPVAGSAAAAASYWRTCRPQADARSFDRQY